MYRLVDNNNVFGEVLNGVNSLHDSLKLGLNLCSINLKSMTQYVLNFKGLDILSQTMWAVSGLANYGVPIEKRYQLPKYKISSFIWEFKSS